MRLGRLLGGVVVFFHYTANKFKCFGRGMPMPMPMQRAFKRALQLPNAEGELFVSMRNPIRIFTAAEEELYFRIESENGKVSMKTSSFVVNK